MFTRFNKKTLAIVAGALVVLVGIFSGGFESLVSDESAVAEESVYVARPSGNLDVVGRVTARHSANWFSIAVLWSEDSSADFEGTTLLVYSTGHARLDNLEAGDIVELEGDFDGTSTGQAPAGFLTVSTNAGFGFLPANWSAD